MEKRVLRDITMNCVNSYFYTMYVAYVRDIFTPEQRAQSSKKTGVIKNLI